MATSSFSRAMDDDLVLLEDVTAPSIANALKRRLISQRMYTNIGMLIFVGGYS